MLQHFSSYREPALLAPSVDLGSSFGPSHPRLEFNPLNLSIGSSVEFRDPDLTGIKAQVYQIATSKVNSDGINYIMVDYDLGAPTDAGHSDLADSDGRIRLRLRCLPDGQGGLEALIFQSQRLDSEASHLFDELQTDPFSRTLRDSVGGFQHGFARIDMANAPYQATRTCLGDPSNERDPTSTVTTYSIKYLDFERTRKDDDGNTFQQYALVEYNPTTKAMITLFGWTIDSTNIIA